MVVTQVSPVPCVLSNPVFRMLSLTAMTGNVSAPASCMAWNARTPLVVSSDTPIRPSSSSGRSSAASRAKLAPSSMMICGRISSSSRSAP